MSIPDLAGLRRTGPPAFHLTTADDDDLAAATAKLAADHPGAAIRRIRATRSRTAPGLFDELAAALQFPTWFGGNWNALRDMLADLSWLPADGYLIVVADADDLLADTHPDAGELALCLTILAEAAAASTVLPFHVLAQAAPDGRIALALTAATIPYDVTPQVRP